MPQDVLISARFGAFGKITALGDFFQTGLGRPFVSSWDAWLQHGMIAAKSALQDRWQDCYLSAPIWRFTLAGGVVCPDPMMGVMMPSVDRVGRFFPLTLAAPIKGNTCISVSHLTATACFEQLETIALSSLNGEMDRQALERNLLAVSPPALAGPVRVSEDATVVVEGNGNLAAVLAGTLLSKQSAFNCVWSAVLHNCEILMTTNGLLTSDCMQGLFNPKVDLQTRDTGCRT